MEGDAFAVREVVEFAGEGLFAAVHVAVGAVYYPAGGQADVQLKLGQVGGAQQVVQVVVELQGLLFVVLYVQ